MSPYSSSYLNLSRSKCISTQSRVVVSGQEGQEKHQYNLHGRRLIDSEYLFFCDRRGCELGLVWVTYADVLIRPQGYLWHLSCEAECHFFDTERYSLCSFPTATPAIGCSPFRFRIDCDHHEWYVLLRWELDARTWLGLSLIGACYFEHLERYPTEDSIVGMDHIHGWWYLTVVGIVRVLLMLLSVCQGKTDPSSCSQTRKLLKTSVVSSTTSWAPKPLLAATIWTATIWRIISPLLLLLVFRVKMKLITVTPG